MPQLKNPKRTSTSPTRYARRHLWYLPSTVFSKRRSLARSHRPTHLPAFMSTGWKRRSAGTGPMSGVGLGRVGQPVNSMPTL